MELSGTGRAGRNGALTQASQKAVRAGRGPGPASARAAQAQVKADRMTLSRQALAFLEEQNRRVEEQARQEQDAKSSDEAMLDVLEKSLKELKTCQTISARIMAGDKVPDEDLRYLMLHDPDSYRLAMAMRKPKKNPQLWESALDDEQREAQARGDDASAVQGTAPAAASGRSGGRSAV